MVSFRCPGEIFDPIASQYDILIYIYPGSIKSIFSLSTTSSHPSHSRDTKPEMSSWPFPDLSLVITMSTLASDWSETQNVTVSVSLSSHSVSQWLPETLICSDIRYKRESPSAQVKGAPPLPVSVLTNQRPALGLSSQSEAWIDHCEHRQGLLTDTRDRRQQAEWWQDYK